MPKETSKKIERILASEMKGGRRLYYVHYCDTEDRDNQWLYQENVSNRLIQIYEAEMKSAKQAHKPKRSADPVQPLTKRQRTESSSPYTAPISKKPSHTPGMLLHPLQSPFCFL
ncbi:hypothetical protein BCR43DRAFT_152143 [Syncephalastrum racemosum]|uniref:Chromo domain-containing protein n=1 Tax=Syncephalastrum racemosum TaxID=13706 RepID=A0A1X2HMZ2_SYNRA|nr:hypothetical protein BCR43DRAFT_152143 [Syncephalastrum racemosum]